MRPILVKKDDVCPGIWAWWELGKVATLIEIKAFSFRLTFEKGRWIKGMDIMDNKTFRP